MGALGSRDYYQLLGVERNAPAERIKQAYIELARVYHPDSNFYTEIIETEVEQSQLAMFQALTNAYNTLIHPQSRREYDAKLAPQLPTWESESGEESFHRRGERKPALKFKEGKRTSEVYGIFGQTRSAHEADPLMEREMNTQTEIIRRRVRAGFWRKLRRMLGL